MAKNILPLMGKLSAREEDWLRAVLEWEDKRTDFNFRSLIPPGAPSINYFLANREALLEKVVRLSRFGAILYYEDSFNRKLVDLIAETPDSAKEQELVKEIRWAQRKTS